MKAVAIRTVLLGLLLAAAVVGLGGCDDTSGPGTVAPTGLVLEDSDGSEVARFSVAGGVTGRIRVDVGEQEDFHVYLLGSTGERIPVDGLRYTVEAGVVNPGVASAVLAESDEVIVTGTGAGPTNLRLTVRIDGRLLFEPFIPIVVS